MATACVIARKNIMAVGPHGRRGCSSQQEVEDEARGGQGPDIPKDIPFNDLLPLDSPLKFPELSQNDKYQTILFHN